MTVRARVLGAGPRVVPEDLRSYVKSLIEQVRGASRFAGEEGRIHRHNTYSAYVMEMLYFLTGHRPVHRAFADERNVDRARKLLLISDKDRTNPTNTRIVPLVEVALRQMDKYQQHVARLTASQPLLAQLRPYKTASRRRPAVFTIDTRNPSVWRYIVSKDIERFRRGHLQAISNLQRSYLSSRLDEMGCRGAYIDAFLGHWHSGLNPFSVYSTLPAVTFAEIMRPLIEEIAMQDGWEVIDAP